MTYQPARPAINLDAITTSEQLSGRLVDGVASYVKLIKQAGALGTGVVNISHGISWSRIISVRCGVEDATPQWIPVPLAEVSSGGALFALDVRVTSTDIQFNIGTGWTSANALSNAWIVVEYLK